MSDVGIMTYNLFEEDEAQKRFVPNSSLFFFHETAFHLLVSLRPLSNLERQVQPAGFIACLDWRKQTQRKSSFLPLIT